MWAKQNICADTTRAIGSSIEGAVTDSDERQNHRHLNGYGKHTQ